MVYVGAALNKPLMARPARQQVKVMAAEFVGAVTASPEMKFGVVVARFNSLVTKQLLEGAHEVFGRHGVRSENVDVSHLNVKSVHLLIDSNAFTRSSYPCRSLGFLAALSFQSSPRLWPSPGSTMLWFASELL